MTRRLDLFRAALLAMAAAAAVASCGEPRDDLDAEPPDASDADHEADADGDEPLPEPRRAETPLIQWVDPFIGTGGVGFGVGSTFPGPQVPFGMVRPGPDTTASSAPPPNHCAGYWYDDPYIKGFSHTRANGMGIPEYGVVALMPTDGMDASKTSWEGYRAPFSHADEEASPGYYAVTFGDSDIRVELTATARVGVHRYTFPAGSDPVVLVDVGHHMADVEVLDGRVEVDPAAAEVAGFVTFRAGYSGRYGGMSVYYAMRFSDVPAAYGVWQAGRLFEGETSRTGADSGAWLGFDATEVEAAVAISFVSEEGARRNLEMPAIEAEWEEALGRVEVEGRSERDFEIFYTALYRTLLMPTLAMDVDGSYRGLDQEVHVADGFTYLTDFSLWDTYRTLHPLLTLLYPERQLDMVRSLVAMARDGGSFPRWPLGVGYTGGMVGDPADIVIADSWVKGVRGFDLREAYDLALVTATAPLPEGSPADDRAGIAEYLELGYVPIEAAGGSASWTLEMAVADFCLGVLAGELGEDEDRASFEERSGNWRNLWDEESGFLIGRNADGGFPDDVAPFAWQDYYAEGNAWQYLWLVPHDLEGLADVMGGREALFARLDTFFEASAAEDYMPVMPSRYYWHGNEPDLHAAWIYSALDRPAGSARWVRWALERHYGDGPDGLPGNDDGGTMSAWYIFSAAGLYPIPGTEDYLLNAPIFTRLVLRLAGGDLVIEAPAASERAVYITAAMLDGVALERARVPWDALPGASLRFDLGPEPSIWATR
jgi:predicted alpha-1,2-mannosidase